MEHGSCPSIDWDATNLKAAWSHFKQHAELMFTGPLSGKEDAVKCSYLLIWAGEKGRDIFNTWTLTAAERDNVTTYLRKFSEHVEPLANPIFARYQFHKRNQRDSESIEQYLTELRITAKECEFGTTSDEMIRDRIVFGVKQDKIRERLLSEGAGLTLARAVAICRAAEATQAQLMIMSNQEHSKVYIKQEVDIVARQGRKCYKCGGNFTPGHSCPPKDFGEFPKCYNCGGVFSKSHQCPAKGKSCIKCKKLNHFAKMCRSSQRNVHSIETGESSTETPSQYFIESIQSKEETYNEPVAKLYLTKERMNVEFKIDTGAEANVIPTRTIDKMVPRPKIIPTSDILTSYTGEPLKVTGICHLEVQYKDREPQIHNFYVVDTDKKPILSRQTSVIMNLIKFIYNVEHIPVANSTDQILAEYEDVFEGIGKMPGKCKIHLKPGAIPSVQPPRRVPMAVQNKLKNELERLVSSGIIEKVTEPTEWVNSIVIVQKPNGEIRICLDPVELNKWIQRPHYPIPTFDDIANKCHGAQNLFKLDARHGYWSMVLDDASSDLTTFNTMFGRFKWRRYPFGIISAQDEYQRRMEEAFEGLGLGLIVDDIAGVGTSTENHDAQLKAVLQRAREKGVKFNRDKCIFNAKVIPYFGHLLTTEGVKPDPNKTRAIAEMPEPKNKEELQTLLGMFNYLSRYIPKLSILNQPLRELGKAKEFVWKKVHSDACQVIRKSLCEHLSYFDTNCQEVEIIVDASQHGLGAQLLVKDETVAFGSRSLSDTEQRYSQIEKELLGIVFACKHFHQYIFGRKVSIITDHKPLENILRKPISKAPPRLQRMMLAIQPYDLTFTYRPGPEIPVADTLSHLHIEDTDPEEELQAELHVHNVIKNIPIKDEMVQIIANCTKDDSEMQIIADTIRKGWPEHRKQCPNEIQEYWNYRNELATHQGILLKGDRIIIPRRMRQEIMNRLHTAHLGVVKTKQRARTCVFWPNITADITKYISGCEICQRFSSCQQQEPLLNSEIPEYPWEHVGTDLLFWEGRNYLVTTDYYSRYIEVDKLDSTSSGSVITKLKSQFARHGIPRILTSDNGPQFAADEFRNFAERWRITHRTSSPRYPQSNGLSEKAVQTVKRLMSKALADKSDPYLALLEYRNTPVDNLASPAQLLMSRQLRSVMPSIEHNFVPNAVPNQEYKEARKKQQEAKKEAYDRHTHPIKPFAPGQPVWLNKTGQAKERWIKAHVTGRYDESSDRSLTVETEDGTVYRRNRKFIRPRYSTNGCKYLQNNGTTLTSMEVPIVPESSYLSPTKSSPSSDASRKLSPREESFETPRANQQPSVQESQNSPSGSKAGTTSFAAQPNVKTTRSGRILKTPSRLNL